MPGSLDRWRGDWTDAALGSLAGYAALHFLAAQAGAVALATRSRSALWLAPLGLVLSLIEPGLWAFVGLGAVALSPASRDLRPRATRPSGSGARSTPGASVTRQRGRALAGKLVTGSSALVFLACAGFLAWLVGEVRAAQSQPGDWSGLVLLYLGLPTLVLGLVAFAVCLASLCAGSLGRGARAAASARLD